MKKILQKQKQNKKPRKPELVLAEAPTSEEDAQKMLNSEIGFVILAFTKLNFPQRAVETLERRLGRFVDLRRAMAIKQNAKSLIRVIKSM